MALPRLDAYQLFANQTENATSDPVVAVIPSGFTLYVDGTLGGGSIQVQLTPDGTTFVDAGTAINAAGTTDFPHAALGAQVVLAGATGANVSVQLVPHDNN
jgi:hypothetical protein